jgi:Phytanoyl-CoA dioxygenase (PhyH)
MAPSLKDPPFDVQALAREFHERGFLIIPKTLSGERILSLNQAVDRDLEQHGEEWVKFDESFIETPDVISRSADFDFAIENPTTLAILRGLIGDLITFEEFEIIIRNQTSKKQDIKSWHRDATRDYRRRMEIEYVSLVYYLTDVSENDHCLSIIPGSHCSLVDLKPEEVTPGTEFDVTGAAGTAVIFHGRCIHAGKLKPSSRQRRTLHIYYARSDQPRYSEWTEIPPRLYQKGDPTLPPLFYSKWNATQIFEGVGKRPRDLPLSMSTAEMILEVQRRTRQAA